jgi:flagellar hook-associated protein 2
MAISSIGIGSGLDANGIVSQLVALERKPIDNLQTAAKSIQTQISSYGKVQSMMSTLRDTAAALGKTSLWNQTTAASSDSTTIAATTTGSVAAGEYLVAVSSMARAQTLHSSTFSSSSAVLGAGTMSIQLVQDYGPPAVPKDGATALNLNFTDPNTTLQDVSKAINAANAGVSAAVVRNVDGTARLALTSASTGLTDQITVSTTGAGFGSFNYPPDAMTGVGMTQSQAAQNAQLSINGVLVESASNQVSGAIDGLTLTLSKESATPVKITVSSDEAAQKKAVDDFVAAYNALNSYLAEQTKYDEASKKAGALQGDSSALNLRNQLRSLVQGMGGNSTAYNTLSSVGLEMQKDGSLKANSTKLAAALKRPEELSKLFANTDIVTPANDGFGVSLRKLADRVTGIDGLLTMRNDNLQGKLKRNQTEQERMEDRVARIQMRLMKEYQALDTKMSGLNALSTYVSQQIASWNASSDS